MRWMDKALVTAFACTALAAPFALALAQDTPRGNGRIIVGYSPGGGTDLVARIIAPAISAAMGVNYIVENRPGASGNIAAEFVAKAPADGGTILAVFNSHSTIAPLFPNLPFNPERDLVSIGQISDTPYLVLARSDIGVDNLRELVDRAMRTGKPITGGTAGRGTPQHLLIEVIGKTTAAPVTAIHYKGSAPAQQDLLGGHLDISLMTPSLGGQLARSGKLKLLAVTSEARLPDFPNAPTVKELGLDALSGHGVWIALLAPAKTPKVTIDRLNKGLNDGLRTDDVASQLKKVGMNPTGGPPERLDRIMQGEQTTWTEVIRELKITVE